MTRIYCACAPFELKTVRNVVSTVVAVPTVHVHVVYHGTSSHYSHPITSVFQPFAAWPSPALPAVSLHTCVSLCHLFGDNLDKPRPKNNNEQCLSIARGPESVGGARVTVVTRKNAGIDLDPAEAAGSSSSITRTSTKIPVDGLFGIYNLLSGPFVAVISRSKLRCGAG